MNTNGRNRPAETVLRFSEPEAFAALCGNNDAHLRTVEQALGIRLQARGNEIRVVGDAYTTQTAERVVKELYLVAKRGYPLYAADVERAVTMLSADPNVRLESVFMDAVYIPTASRHIAPKGLAQKQYIDAIRAHDIVFAVGPAGTGKTYLAMSMAVAALLGKQFSRIVLCRPAVEAGERLGFLPGDLAEKVNPYLRPLYDALHDMMEFEKALKLIERGKIEVAPLAFMRGRTLNDAFVILDEAQNATVEQMKMFLTRLGYDAKAVITGDVTQTDLPGDVPSGMVHALQILGDVPGIAICRFSSIDVVRHPLVQRVIEAYERDAQRRQAARAPHPGGVAHARGPAEPSTAPAD